MSRIVTRMTKMTWVRMMAIRTEISAILLVDNKVDEFILDSYLEDRFKSEFVFELKLD